MISALYRLPLRSDPLFFRKSTRVDTSLFTAYIRTNELGHVRCSLIIPKKVQKLATRRNLLKRLLLPRILSQEGAQPNLDIVIRLKNGNIFHETDNFSTSIRSVSIGLIG